MSSIDTTKLAELLTGLADYVDAIETDRTTKSAAERDARIDKIASNYESATGESLPDSVRSKLATVEVDALEHLLKIANNSDGSPTSLGGSDDRDSSAQPSTIKEAASQAEDRFMSWILS